MPQFSQAEKPDEFCLVRDDLWFRVQRRMGLIPKDGKDGALRRTIFFCMLAWLPLVIWALATGRGIDQHQPESLLNHYSVHTRFLIALPALIFGERLARNNLRRILPKFIQMGVVPEEKHQAFRDLILGMIRLRDSTLPWVAIASVILVTLLYPGTGEHTEELAWARDGGKLGFGGWWFLCVSRPIYQIFLFAWLWRVVLLFIAFKRIAGLGLKLLPPHPDHLGGLGFLSITPRCFIPLAFACSCLFSSKWAHEIAFHGAHVSALKVHGGIFIGFVLVICITPLAVFLPTLKKAKRRGLADYGALIARHGRLVENIWIRGEEVKDRSLLEAPELGPSCDIGSIYDSVRSMRALPITKASLMPLALPLALPLLAVSTMEVPIGELIGKVLHSLL